MTRDELMSQAALQVVAETAVHAWLCRDFWTVARTQAEVEDSGVSVAAVAEAFGLAAAALMTDACGGSSARAARVATERLGTDAGRHARLLLRSGEAA